MRRRVSVIDENVGLCNYTSSIARRARAAHAKLATGAWRATVELVASHVLANDDAISLLEGGALLAFEASTVFLLNVSQNLATFCWIFRILLHNFDVICRSAYGNLCKTCCVTLILK